VTRAYRAVLRLHRKNGLPSHGFWDNFGLGAFASDVSKFGGFGRLKKTLFPTMRVNPSGPHRNSTNLMTLTPD